MSGTSLSKGVILSGMSKAFIKELDIIAAG